MGYGYSKVVVKNETEKCWKVTLTFCHKYNVHSHDDTKRHTDDACVQPHSSHTFSDIHKPWYINVEFASSGSSSDAKMCSGAPRDFPEGKEHVFRIRQLDRKSAELYQDDGEYRGRRDKCGHPDVEGDLQEAEERRRKQLEREKELEKQIQSEREEKRQRLAEANRELQNRLESNVTTKKQQVLRQSTKCTAKPTIVVEEISASKIYDNIVASRPAYRKFEQSESLHKYLVTTRCGYLASFILADYCQAHNIPDIFHKEIQSVTRFNELSLTDRLTILDAFSKSVHAFDMFDDLTDLIDTLGFFNVDAAFELFLRLICVTVHTNAEVAANLFLHCLEKLPSRYRGSSVEFRSKEKETLFLLISNGIWTPLSAFELVYDIEGEHRADTLQKSLVYQVAGESVMHGAPFILRERISLQSPSCTSDEVDEILHLVIEMAKSNDDVVPEINNDMSFEQFAECIAVMSKRTKVFQSVTGHLRKTQLRLLIECLVCETPSRDWLTSVDGDLKSAVVAVVAAIQARLGHVVDIAVSNEKQASKDAERWGEFFALMGLSSVRADKTDQCCKIPMNIVYCTPSQIENMEGISRPCEKFTCLIICDESYEPDVEAAELSTLFPKYKFYYNLTKTTSVFRQENGIKDVKKAVQRQIGSEGDKTLRQVLDEITATKSMSHQMYRRLDEIVQKYTTMEGDEDKYDAKVLHEHDLRSTSGIARAVSSIATHVKKHTNFYPRNNQIVAVITLLLEHVEEKYRTGGNVRKLAEKSVSNSHVQRHIRLFESMAEEDRSTNRNSNVKGGWFLEVATGEGKSTIVAMFSAIQALQGKYVDVVTSSDVLARRDEEEWREFYEDLGLSSCVVPNPEVLKCESQTDADDLLRRKYQSSIVYGTVSEFAADVLRHEFDQRNIRGNRPFEVVIVDEVDSMTLDNGMQLTYLSHDTTSLRHIEQLLAMIWCLLSSSLPIQSSQTGDILWASQPKYIHTAIAEAMIEDNDQLMDKACDILQDCCSSPLNLFKREECDRIRQLSTNGGMEESEDAIEESEKLMKSEERLKMTQTIMESITPDDEVSLIKSQNMSDVSFRLYKLDANNKATLCFEEHTDNVCDGEGNTVMLLLLEKGVVRELFTEQDLKTVAINSIGEKIRYSDGSMGAKKSTEGNTKVESKVETRIPNEVESQCIVLPMYLKEYVDQCLPIFIDNALKALLMTSGREYYIVDGRDSPSGDQDQDHSSDKVVPVDFEGTGMLEKNKKWSDGLQQFLEMKHQLAISPVSTVTNFLSNYRFFQRYCRSGGIHGVTGTLGDSTDHKFLRKHFSTKCISIPPHRTKKLVHHPMLQIRDKGRESWIAAVCKRTEEIAKEQTVLVVCEDLKTAESFERELKSSASVKIHMYTRSDIHKYEIEEHLFNREEVIITTTLGGRGTDYKVHRDVTDNGGLFVILTFFPENLRVEKQMIGRTARKGDPGMVQFILHDKSLPEAYQGQGLNSMHSVRLHTVEEKIRNLEASELINVNRREDLFEAFCTKLQSFDHHYTHREKDPRNLTESLTSRKFDYGSGLSSVKEKWAFWLTLKRSRIEDSRSNLRSLQEDMERIIQTKIDETQRGESNNCYDHARNAMHRMPLLGKGVNRVAENDFGTFTLWKRLLDTEKVYNAVALYNQAYVTIKTRKDGNSYREKAITLLDKTLTAIEAYTTEMANVTYSVQIASSSGNSKSHLADEEGQTNFSKQQTARGSFIKAWRDSINSAKDMLKSEKNPDDFEFYVEPIGLNFAVDVSNGVMEEEMMLLADIGVTYFFKVEKEKKFKFCWNALWCFLLGALQVVAGVLLVGLTCGAASTFGFGLVSEGISDMIDGVTGMATGTFSWVQYAISKAISLATSLVASGISALKRAAKTAWKGAKTTVSGLKGAATATAKTAAKEATNKAMKANFKLAGKYIVKEVGKRAVSKGVGILWDKALIAILENIFRNNFRDTIKANLKTSPSLRSSLERAIQQNLTTLEDPSESDKEQLMKIVQLTCENTVLQKILNSFEKFDKVWNQMERFQGLASNIASKAGSGYGTAVKIAYDVGFYTRMITEAIKRWPTGSYMKDTVASELSTEINSVLKLASSNGSLESDTEKAVYERMYDSICETVTNLFTDKIVQCLVSMSERHACQYVSSKLGSVAANVLGEANVNRQIADQDHYWAMKVDSDKTTHSKKLSREDLEQVNQLADEAADPSKEASDLHLNVLAQSGLTDGRDIIIDIVDEKGKSITSAKYEGGSDKEPIKVQLVQTKDGDRSIRDVLSGKPSSYSGHFQARDEHGNVMTGGDSGSSNCLFDAIAHSTGKDPIKLRQEVAGKIREEPGKWKAPLERQRQHEANNRNSSLFSVKGGKASLSVKKHNKELLDRCIGRYKQKAGFTESDELSQQDRRLKLGTVDQVEILRKEGKHVAATEQDHIPPKSCIGDSQSELAMTVRKEHHKAALSSLNWKESQLARGYVKTLLNSSNPEEVTRGRHLSYAIAHPDVSNTIRRATGFSANCQNVGNNSRKYYREGFLNHSATVQAQNGGVNETALTGDVEFIKTLTSGDETQILNNNTIRGLVEHMTQ